MEEIEKFNYLYERLDSRWNSTDDIKRNIHRTKIYKLLDLLEPDRSLLDVCRGGSVDGILGVWAAKKGLDVTICSVKQIYLDVIKKFAQDNNVNNIKYVLCEPANLVFDNETFDYVSCIHVLEHVDQFNCAMNELWRVTKEYVIIALPTCLNACVFARIGGADYYHFTKKSIPAMLLGMIKVLGGLISFRQGVYEINSEKGVSFMHFMRFPWSVKREVERHTFQVIKMGADGICVPWLKVQSKSKINLTNTLIKGFSVILDLEHMYWPEKGGSMTIIQFCEDLYLHIDKNNIIAVLLTGSTAEGKNLSRSDTDIRIIVHDYNMMLKEINTFLEDKRVISNEIEDYFCEVKFFYDEYSIHFLFYSLEHVEICINAQRKSFMSTIIDGKPIYETEVFKQIRQRCLPIYNEIKNSKEYLIAAKSYYVKAMSRYDTDRLDEFRYCIRLASTYLIKYYLNRNGRIFIKEQSIISNLKDLCISKDKMKIYKTFLQLIDLTPSGFNNNQEYIINFNNLMMEITR